MVVGIASRPSFSGRIVPADAGFDPCADRAWRLDARMRERLADSVRYVAVHAASQLRVPDALLARFLERLAQGPVSPHAFAAYYDLVLALEDDDLEDAARQLDDLLAAPAARGELRIFPLGNPAEDRNADRYRRHVDTDAEQALEVLPPPPELAAACCARIQTALARLDAGHPELAAEIRALIREIVLAVGPSGPDAWHFDGASSFMLWGAVVLNPAEQATPLEVVQALAHESAHNLLFGFSADGPLVENDGRERFSSPLRVDPRPIDGIFHATFVTARMHHAVARLRETGALEAGEHAEAEQALATNTLLFAQGLETLDRHARLTPIGAAALDGARAYMQRGA